MPPREQLAALANRSEDLLTAAERAAVGAGGGVTTVAAPAVVPVIAVAAVLVARDGGSPFYTQMRVGRNGRAFRMLKLRTMVCDADDRMQVYLAQNPAARLEWDSTQKLKADPRITKAGRFLRKSSLDELPQLFNVLLGHMSLVGPRPEVPHYVALYPDSVRDLVLSVRPGITDRASIEFRDESTLLGQSSDPERTYVEQILPIKLRYAAEYARSHTLWSDLKIIVRTASALWGDRPSRG